MKKLLLALVFVVAVLQVFATIVITGRSSERIGRHLLLFEDTTAVMNIYEVERQHFVPGTQAVPNLGIGRSAHWVKVSVHNKSGSDELFIDLQSPSIDQVWFYAKQADGSFRCDSLSDRIPVSQRIYTHQNYVFPIRLAIDSSATYYLRVISGDQVQLPVVIGTESSINAQHNKGDLFFGLYAGIMLALLLYNIFVYIGIRERSYLLYVMYIGVVFLTQANLLGYSLRFFFPLAPELERYAVFVFSSVVPFFGVGFTIQFLNVGKYLPKSLYFFYVMAGLYAVALTLALLGNFQVSYKMLQVCAGATATAQLVVAIILALRGVPNSRKYLLAWSTFLLGLIAFVLKDFEILPFNTFTFGMMAVGSAAESVLLSFALADRINQLKTENALSQQKALEALRKNEVFIKNQNEFLEKKVHERTVELEHTNAELVSTVKDLKLTQSQLLESEKLASLGQMTAGIAHELNNPINFVSSNVQPLKRDIRDIVELLSDYSSLNGGSDYQEKLQKIKEKHRKMDVGMLTGEIDTLLSGINEGARRTAEIVKGLRVFARADKDTSISANINECIKSAIIVMKSALRGKCDMEVELDADMPDVYCYPGKLTQVVMNLIANGIYANERTGRPYLENRITIRSWFDPHHTYFSVADNGTGMSENMRSKIFEPFFTTKPVGVGTGLGLSIVSGIINDHQGTIQVRSEEGKGSEFIVQIPIMRR